MTNARLCVLGAGSWGTALANLLAVNGNQVTLWSHDKNQVESLKQTRINEPYLPGFQLSEKLTFSESLDSTVSNVDGIIIATPSHALREILKKIQDKVSQKVLFTLACKGFEEKTGLLLHRVFEQELCKNQLTVLSGPTFAKEVIQGLPTAVTIATSDPEAGKKVISWFHNQSFRPYLGHDIIGVEFGGAVKNIMAIAAGISDGLKLGANSRAALISRGLHEMINLGIALGADKSTLMGLSGMGDLVLTCTDNLSRNRQLGLLLAEGKALEDAKLIIGQEVEGVRAARVAFKLAEENRVEVPIINRVYQVLFNKLSPKKAVMDLMNREIKEE